MDNIILFLHQKILVVPQQFISSSPIRLLKCLHAQEMLTVCTFYTGWWYIRVKFSNFYLLIGWKIKSYFANSENFWPFGLHKGHKAKKGQKMKFCQMNQNSLIHGEN